MSHDPLDRLVNIGQLKVERFSQSKLDGLVQSGKARLVDAGNNSLNLPNELWRVMDQAHRKRNLAEYEGQLDVDEKLVDALIRVANEVANGVSCLQRSKER